MTIPERMIDVEVDETTGIVTHNHLFSQDGKERRTFESKEVYKRWLSQ